MEAGPQLSSKGIIFAQTPSSTAITDVKGMNEVEEGEKERIEHFIKEIHSLGSRDDIEQSYPKPAEKIIAMAENLQTAANLEVQERAARYQQAAAPIAIKTVEEQKDYGESQLMPTTSGHPQIRETVAVPKKVPCGLMLPHGTMRSILGDEKPHKTLGSPMTTSSAKQEYQALRFQISSLADELSRKLQFLHITPEGLSDIQILQVELKTRLSDWEEGGIDSKFLLSKLKEAADSLRDYEVEAAPKGWIFQWDRTTCRYQFLHLSTGEINFEYPTSMSAIEGEEEDEEEEGMEEEASEDATVRSECTSQKEEKSIVQSAQHGAPSHLPPPPPPPPPRPIRVVIHSNLPPSTSSASHTPSITPPKTLSVSLSPMATTWSVTTTMAEKEALNSVALPQQVSCALVTPEMKQRAKVTTMASRDKPRKDLTTPTGAFLGGGEMMPAPLPRAWKYENDALNRRVKRKGSIEQREEVEEKKISASDVRRKLSSKSSQSYRSSDVDLTELPPPPPPSSEGDHGNQEVAMETSAPPSKLDNDYCHSSRRSRYSADDDKRSLSQGHKQRSSRSRSCSKECYVSGKHRHHKGTSRGSSKKKEKKDKKHKRDKFPKPPKEVTVGRVGKVNSLRTLRDTSLDKAQVTNDETATSMPIATSTGQAGSSGAMATSMPSTTSTSQITSTTDATSISQIKECEMEIDGDKGSPVVVIETTSFLPTSEPASHPEVQSSAEDKESSHHDDPESSPEPLPPGIEVEEPYENIEEKLNIGMENEGMTPSGMESEVTAANLVSPQVVPPLPPPPGAPDVLIEQSESHTVSMVTTETLFQIQSSNNVATANSSAMISTPQATVVMPSSGAVTTTTTTVPSGEYDLAEAAAAYAHATRTGQPYQYPQQVAAARQQQLQQQGCMAYSNYLQQMNQYGGGYVLGADGQYYLHANPYTTYATSYGWNYTPYSGYGAYHTTSGRATMATLTLSTSDKN